MRSRISDERGISIIEVVVAALILTVSALALLRVTDAASRNTYRAEQSQVVVNRLQAELERIRQLPFSDVALKTPPETPIDPSLATRLSATTFALERDGTAAAPLAVKGGTSPGGEPISSGEINPGPEEFTSGDVGGTIYRYVVYPGVPANCDACNPDDLKRVIVAIALDETAPGGERVYQEVQSEVANPDAVPADNELPPPPGGGTPDTATFYLTDTPCNNTTRQALTAHHDTHNTRGICSQGMQTGDAAGAPDLMVTEPPPTPDSGAEPFYDYATDVEPSQDPLLDVGLTVREGGTNGCLLDTPTVGLDRTLDFLGGETTKSQKMHMWLSNELSPDFRLLTSATGDLNLWTRTINGQPYAGKICIWVFKRVSVNIPLVGTVTADIPAINTQPPLVDAEHFVFQRSFWPQEWTEIRVPTQFIWADSALTSLGGTLIGEPRLGLAITVERASTAGSGLEFMYDHRERDSRFVIHNQQDLILGG